MNMSYCRFENTLRDLQDCADNLHDKLEGEEKAARRQLIDLCAMILEESGMYAVEETTQKEIDEHEQDDEEAA